MDMFLVLSEEPGASSVQKGTLESMVNYTNDISKQKLRTLWNNMNTRCYNENYHAESPQYIGCEVCQEWLDDKENFYDWVKENYYTVGSEQMDLDKDILVKNNKIYSPETCIFAPHNINVYFENLTREPLYVPSKHQYKMSIFIDGKNVDLGLFDTEEAAKAIYIKHKEAAILAKADIYKDSIPGKLYDAMINWKIELEDWES